VGLIDRLLRRESSKEIIAKAVSTQPTSKQLPDVFEELYTIGFAIEPPYDPLKLLSLSETNEIHSAALHAVATDAVGRGWTFVPLNEEADEEEKDEVAKLLNNLSPQYTFGELLYQAAWEQLAIGWAAWEVVRDDDGSIGAVYPMPAQTIRLTKDPDVYVQHKAGQFRYFKRFGAEATLNPLTGRWEDTEEDASEVIFFSRYSPRSRYGIPHWVSCLASIAEYNAIRDYSLAFFESSGTVGRLMVLKTDAPEVAQRYVQEITTELHNAVAKYHSTLVLGLPSTVEVAVEKLNPDMREGNFLRRREELIKAILMAHSVPPYRVGWAVLGGLGGSAAREMLQTYRHGVVEPIQTVFEDRLNKTLFGPEGLNLQNFKWKLEDLDWEETELNLEVATKAVEAGLMTPNEARRELGLEAAEDPAMDAHYYRGQEITEPQLRKAVDILKELRDALKVVAVNDVLSSSRK